MLHERLTTPRRFSISRRSIANRHAGPIESLLTFSLGMLLPVLVESSALLEMEHSRQAVFSRDLSTVPLPNARRFIRN